MKEVDVADGCGIVLRLTLLGGVCSVAAHLEGDADGVVGVVQQFIVALRCLTPVGEAVGRIRCDFKTVGAQDGGPGGVEWLAAPAHQLELIGTGGPQIVWERCQTSWSPLSCAHQSAAR